MDKYMVRAPISGYVDEIMPKEGELVGPQMPIMRIINLDKVFVTADVSEALLGKVKKNDQVNVIFKSLNKTVSGKIIQTGDIIDPNNRTFRIKVELSERSDMFKPNLLSTVQLNDYTNDKAILIPTNTILEDLNGAYVFVKKADKGVKKSITTGVSYKGEIEALTGLNDGDQLITAGFKTLVDGEYVTMEHDAK